VVAFGTADEVSACETLSRNLCDLGHENRAVSRRATRCRVSKSARFPARICRAGNRIRSAPERAGFVPRPISAVSVRNSCAPVSERGDCWLRQRRAVSFQTAVLCRRFPAYQRNCASSARTLAASAASTRASAAARSSGVTRASKAASYWSSVISPLRNCRSSSCACDASINRSRVAARKRAAGFPAGCASSRTPRVH